MRLATAHLLFRRPTAAVLSSTRAAFSSAPSSAPTHAVTNQATPLQDYNAYSDPAVREGVTAGGGAWATADLEALGGKVGSAAWQDVAARAQEHPPKLQTHDRFGNRVDRAVYDPSYHELMGLGVEHGVASYAWDEDNRGRAGAHVARGALMHLMYQLDAGVCCPLTMTYASVPALRNEPALADVWIPRVVARGYDGGDGPAERKPGATIGMSMTEKQGGSDVRVNTTVAVPVAGGGRGAAYDLVGHKWFTSAPMSDAFLTLAQIEGDGVSCFLVPRWLPEEDGGGTASAGTAADTATPPHAMRNAGFQLQRLKDKLGDKSNASSEVEYNGAKGYLLGDPGRGVRTIVDMVIHTRLDCTIGSAALMVRH